MHTVFSGPLHVHYSQFYVESRGDDFFDDLTESRAGQSNGLCGAAVPGLLFLTPGLHTGDVELAVEVHERAPVMTDLWEDVVEASFHPSTQHVVLVQWAAEKSWPLPMHDVDYRVQYSATGMDAGRARDTRLDGEPPSDRYLLQFWTAPAEPDCVLRQTSRNAAYWHEVARALPPPPSPPTAA